MNSKVKEFARIGIEAIVMVAWIATMLWIWSIVEPIQDSTPAEETRWDAKKAEEKLAQIRASESYQLQKRVGEYVLELERRPVE